MFATLIALSLFQTAFLAKAVPGVAEAMQSPVVLTSAAVMYALMAAAVVVPGKRTNIAVLVLLGLRYVFQYLT